MTRVNAWNRTERQQAAYEMRQRRGDFWEKRRRALGLGDRKEVAAALGISWRALYRYEFENPPAWYDLALVGLWNYRQVKAE